MSLGPTCFQRGKELPLAYRAERNPARKCEEVMQVTGGGGGGKGGNREILKGG